MSASTPNHAAGAPTTPSPTKMPATTPSKSRKSRKKSPKTPSNTPTNRPARNPGSILKKTNILRDKTPVNQNNKRTVTFDEPPCKRKMTFNSEDDDNILGDVELTSDTMERVQLILSHQFREINGFQCTLLVPKYISATKTWDYTKKDQFESRAGPTTQIHYCGGHWVTSYQAVNGNVTLLDSLWYGLLSPSLEIQLAKIYGHNQINRKLSIAVSHCQQQKSGSVDCGVFAVANAVEFCLNQQEDVDRGVRDWDFDMSKAREHLKECLDQELFTEFPKKKTSSQYMDKEIFKIELLCPCGLPEVLDNMVECDRCRQWHHYKCADVANFSFSGVFKCSPCKTKRPVKKSLKLRL